MRDTRLAARLRAGERGALDRIIELYTPYISVIVHRILSPSLPREDIEEVVADIFITLWQNADKVNGDTLRGYLAAIARSRAVNRLRQAKPPCDSLSDSEPSALPQPEAQALENERAALLRNVVARLGPQDRDIFLRYYYERQSIQTIADALHLSPSAVKSRLLRGRKKLRADFTERGVTFEELL